MTKTVIAWEETAAEVMAELRRIDGSDEATVVLIGSVAREAATEKSDIDLLIVSPDPLPQFNVTPSAQIFRITRSDFLGRLRCGDDFPQWAVRYGKVLLDEAHWWDELQRNPALQQWPDWRRKRDQGKKRLAFAKPLLESGDGDHAREELLLSARHLGRALLLKEREFPLSQPELPGQLREIGQSKIAELLDSLVDEAVAPSALEQAERVIVASVEKLDQ